MSKYGLLKYTTENLGDEVQSLAARQYLPRVDYLIDRDFLSDFRAPEPVQVILNGWYMHKPFSHRPPEDWSRLNQFKHKLRKRIFSREMLWPPSEAILPLIVSFHIRSDSLSKDLLDERSLRYFRRFGPVGCRDLSTLEMLTQKGVDAYFSGCLTLTLPHYKGSRGEDIYFVDPFGPDGEERYWHPGDKLFRNDLWLKIPERIRKSAHFVTQFSRERNPTLRLNQAGQFLEQLSRAKLVVTGRLHCALPCLAMGTPVLLIYRHQYWSRIETFLKFMHHCDLDSIEQRGFDVDWDSPLHNPDTHVEIAHILRKRCEDFIEKAG